MSLILFSVSHMAVATLGLSLISSYRVIPATKFSSAAVGSIFESTIVDTVPLFSAITNEPYLPKIPNLSKSTKALFFYPLTALSLSIPCNIKVE